MRACNKWIDWLEKQDSNLVKNGYTNNKDVIEYAGNYSREIWHKLMDNFKNIKDYYIGCNDVSDIVLNAIINVYNWLEKQGEQKVSVVEFNAKDWYVSKVDGKIHNLYHSVDKVKPKFEIGNWVISTLPGIKYPHLITDIKDGYYIFGEDDDHAHIASNDDILKLWTIEDARDGDVLHSTGWHNDCIFIFNCLDNWKFDEPNGDRAVATGYCCLSVSADNMEFGIQGPDCVEVNTIKPATKIQRDLLFQKMEEAGYTFDFEKKELKKIKDEPLVIDEGKAEMDYCFTKMMNGEKVSSTWSEEDEKMVKDIIAAIDTLYYHGMVNWLKSLKYRVQPKQEWTEEDERIYQSIIDDTVQENQLDDKQINWLKLLKQRYTWKPSYEQLEALWCATEKELESDDPNVVELRGKVLESLYNELKKMI